MSSAFRVLGPTTYAGSLDRLSPVVHGSTTPATYKCGVYYFPGWSTPGGGPNPSDPWPLITPYPDRIPLALGQYDETNQTVVDTQLNWMYQYGVTFVAIDWFMQWSGSTLQPYLDHVITKYLTSAVSKPLFCIQFANQTNAGGLNTSTAHSLWDYWIANYFADSNYYKIGNKPVVIINSGPTLRNNFASHAEVKSAFLDAGDAAAVTAGYAGIHWMDGQADSSSAWIDVSDPAHGWTGVTGSNVYTTTKVSDNSAGPSPTTYADLDNAVFSGLVGGYRGFCYGWMNDPDITVFWPPLTAGFDSTPWSPSTTLHGMPTSAEWGTHLSNAKTLLDANATQTQLTFMIEAWNEFGEGSILCPTVGNGGFDRLRQLNSTFSLNAADMTPAAFSFTDVTSATISTVYTSNTITATSIDVTGEYSVSGTGVTVSKNGGAYSADPGIYVVNDTFTLRLTSAATGNVATSGTLTLSGVSDTYTVTTANTAPTNITLSNSSVLTTSGVNAVVGTLSTTDIDIGQTYTYTLVAGTGSTNNASFNISGANLRVNDPNALGAGSYSVRIQTDDGSATFAKAFSIDVFGPSTGRGLIKSIERNMIIALERPVAV